MPNTVEANHFLTNPVWVSLNTLHADVALRQGNATRYPHSVAGFVGLPAEATDEDWRDAAALAGDASPLLHISLRPVTPPPSLWDVLARREALQMIAPDSFGRIDDQVIRLGPEDVPDMLKLVADAGPTISFRPRALDIGEFYGIRHGRRLIAMGGSRFHGPGWIDLSGGCVHTEYRGQGLGRRLLRHRTAVAESRREVATLLVFTDNPARELFARWGWRAQRTMHIDFLNAVHFREPVSMVP